jgi:hypothetical protein
MAGFGRRERDPRRLRVAHLPDDNHVGRLPKRGPQRGGEIGRVDADFDLLDDAALVHVVVFDRILDGDDVPRIASIDLPDERGGGRGLARSGRAADQHQATRERRENTDVVREVKIRQPRDSQRQRADRSRRASALAVEIHPEPSQGANGKRKIDHCAAMIGVLQPRRHERHHRGLDILGAEHELRGRLQSA